MHDEQRFCHAVVAEEAFAALVCRAQLPVSRTLITCVNVDKLEHAMYAWLAAS